MKKAKAFFCILQDGGFEVHEQIAAGDKDFQPAFKTFMDIAIKDIQDCAQAVDSVEKVYGDEDLDAIAGIHEDMCEDFLDEIFDVKARLPSLEWCDQVAKKANWVFDPTKLRERLADKAEIEKKFNKEEE